MHETTKSCYLLAQDALEIRDEAIPETGAGQVLVKMSRGGICGSDLHYYRHGGIGTIRVREPIILGHEASGHIEALGDGATHLETGMLVTINPSRPCGSCAYCMQDMPIHCLAMRFSGSAMHMPHEPGLFRERMVVDAAQCIPLGPDTSPGEAACCEPLAVCLHAANRAGELQGRKILITGAGPIGCLCAAVARMHGAAEIVITDMHDFTLAVAEKMGATRAINVADAPHAFEQYCADKGYFDVVLECSGAGAAITAALRAIVPCGVFVQVGLAGNTPIPVDIVVGKEINFLGSQRFHDEFAMAAKLIADRTISVAPIITQDYGIGQLRDAFEIAGDRTRAVKVHLDFG